MTEQSKMYLEIEGRCLKSEFYQVLTIVDNFKQQGYELVRRIREDYELDGIQNVNYSYKLIKQ